MNFKNFLEGYIEVGLIICAIILIFGLLIGPVTFGSDHKAPMDFHNNLYEAIAAVDENKAQETKLMRAASLIKKSAKTNVHIKGYRKSIGEIGEIGNDFRKFYSSNYDEIKKFVDGEAEYTEFIIKGATWKTFWTWFGVLYWLCFSIGMTINCGIGALKDSGSVFALPWDKLWFYPFFLIMLPPYIVIMFVEIVVRLIIKFWQLIVWILNEIAFFIKIMQKKIYEMLCGFALSDYTKDKLKKLNMTDEIYSEKKKKDLQYEENKRKANVCITNAQNYLDESKRLWVDYFSSELELQKNQLQKIVKTYRSDLSKLGQKVSQTQKKLADSQKKLSICEKGYEQKKGQTDRDCLGEFDRILSLPKVITIKIENEILKVFTDIIYINYNMGRYEIGKFSIEVNMRDNSIFIRNLCSTHPNNYYHPYAESGNFCWGNMYSAIFNALNRKEYNIALIHILKAMQSPAGDNPGGVTKWRRS
ncbi:hypothetical protein KAJ61_02040 [Candidatus Parcubacteria bacterium]|nr:hypothetical protein [Candidatus Parcubacteria bacterium]